MCILFWGWFLFLSIVVVMVDVVVVVVSGQGYTQRRAAEATQKTAHKMSKTNERKKTLLLADLCIFQISKKNRLYIRNYLRLLYYQRKK